jgi:hypothetical protein
VNNYRPDPLFAPIHYSNMWMLLGKTIICICGHG